MKISKLNESGLAHYLLPGLVMFVIATIGTYLVVSSHADQVTIATNTTTGTSDTQSVIVNNDDSGKTISLQSGQILTVRLSNTFATNVASGQTATSSSWWDNFTLGSPGILTHDLGDVFTQYGGRPLNKPGASYIQGTSLQRYSTVRKGITTLSATSTSSEVCGVGVACPRFVVPNTFKITVVVQ